MTVSYLTKCLESRQMFLDFPGSYKPTYVFAWVSG